MEKTLVIIKPDGVERGLIGEVISRYERKGLKIKECRLINATKDILEQHYIEHKEKPFYEGLVSYMMRGPVVVMIVEGNEAIQLVRNINGSTKPTEAAMGTIRGDFANSVTENIVHASDSIESSEREISIWF
ncbi:nucleoside diphosphate kinase Ndk [Gottschalkia purinilytica]|uniref:Nucleoside diphosphate kinase n=1 Tax=Gottschalkia purinilytica TaxID=1503 RepID=A0A0L0WDM5_GOTPU|nr:nucleoside-diphosphate kinase [Gottschalkia purinilytica]KNF09577.1 nucleoside diphosphate kinase Ndk [Gottschalkia purinilytica]